MSPDGKMVAFVVLIGGKRQIFVSLLAGGAQLQLTRPISITNTRGGRPIRAR